MANSTIALEQRTGLRKSLGLQAGHPHSAAGHPVPLGHPAGTGQFLDPSSVSHYPLCQVPTLPSVFVITAMKNKQKAIVLRFLSWNTFKSLKCTVIFMKEKNSFMLQINIPFTTFPWTVFKTLNNHNPIDKSHLMRKRNALSIISNYFLLPE